MAYPQSYAPSLADTTGRSDSIDHESFATSENTILSGSLYFDDQDVINHTLEVDSSETDSALGDDGASYKPIDYRFENGRRYHAYHDGAYYLPNDEVEAERLDLQHHVWRRSLDDKLYISPIPSNISSVLDVGTGTGVWAIEFADDHPNANVIGTDLSPIQPTWVPPNCKFEIDDAEQEWTFSSPFDFIHGRMLCLGMHDWPRFFHQAWDNLKPGAWIEVQEVQFPMRCEDGSAGPDSAFLEWGNLIQEAARRGGIDTMASNTFGETLRTRGFVNCKQENVMWAIGGWPKGKLEKEIGRFTRRNILQGLEGISMALLTKHLEWSREKVETILVDVRKELKDPKLHFHIQMTVNSAQKPV